MTDTVAVTPATITGTVIAPLVPLTLDQLRADFAKPLSEISLAANILRHFTVDLTPWVGDLQSLLANDELMGDVLLLVNYARADGVGDLAAFKVWSQAKLAALAAWLPKRV